MAVGEEQDTIQDVYEPYLNGEYQKIDPRFKNLGKRIPEKQPDFGRRVARHKDFRRVLDDKEIDAVIIATPDHWHAIQMIEVSRNPIRWNGASIAGHKRLVAPDV